jgi:MOSC domain-containing protein YiiM
MSPPFLRSIQAGKVQTHDTPQAAPRGRGRWNRRDLGKLVRNTRRTGSYLRVLGAGYVESGVPLVLFDRPYPQRTVARAIDIMSNRGRDHGSALQLGACPALSTG